MYILESDFFLCGASVFVLFTKYYFRGTCGMCGGKEKYKLVQIWPGHMRLVYTEISPGHIWTTLYIHGFGMETL